jgi:phosphohistidine phosphatase
MQHARTLYLLRHAIAAPSGAAGFADADRPLTPEGIRKMKAAAKGMRGMNLGFERLWSSPYRRARETAEIVAGVFKLDIEFHDALVPDAPLRRIVADLGKPPAKETGLVLVGHQPQLGVLASFLIAGDENARIELKKGSLCKLTVDPNAPLEAGRAAVLNWLLAPAQLRR